ncbi:MAG: hypothetical protein P4L40_17360 [Terracidiphilus sp.]|nr:hypothetical protein [Terracidiphilus sp.]
MCVCVCCYGRENVCVCVKEGERACVCKCVCVCVLATFQALCIVILRSTVCVCLVASNRSSLTAKPVQSIRFADVPRKDSVVGPLGFPGYNEAAAAISMRRARAQTADPLMDGVLMFVNSQGANCVCVCVWL